MDEKEILLKTIEGLNASVASLSATNKDQAEQIKNLQERIKELTAQVAWLNRQLFGRKSEKLRTYDPNMPDLFTEEFAGLRQQEEEKRDEAVEKIEKEPVEVRKQKRQNRKMTEDLPVLETEVIEPTGVDLSLYRRIGEEITKVVKHKPGMLYVKEIIRPKYALKASTGLPPVGQKGVEIASMPLMPVDKCIADASLLAEILLQKYEYHVPFYRQIRQYRHLGIKGLTESTLDGWFKKTVELLGPCMRSSSGKSFPATIYRRMRPLFRLSTGKSTRPRRNICGWQGQSWRNWSSSITTRDRGPERSSNPWQTNITSRVTFNATVLRATRQPSRPAPTCSWSTAWCISAVILNRLLTRTGRWQNKP